MKKRILFLSVFALAIVACSKEDNKPIEQPNTGGGSGQTQQPQQPESISEGGVFKPSVGGANEPNQVFIDLSTKSETAVVKRDSWDFGFYCGDDFRVILNSAVGTTTPEKGSTALDGDPRGFKKVRITRSGNDYVIHYANLNDTTHKSITVKKDPSYNFVFVSLSQEKTVNVQPEKTKWDISFSGLTNYTAMRGGKEITYYFADMVTNNFYSGVKVMKIVAEKADKRDTEYEAYNKAKASEINFDDPKLNHQLGIGASWRDTFNRKLADNIFYIIKDGSGNLYKLKFLALSNESEERGHPVFEYALLK